MKHRAVCTFLNDSRSFHRSRMTFDIFTEYKEVESKVKHRLIKTRIAAEPTHYICFNTLEINVKPSRGFWEKWQEYKCSASTLCYRSRSIYWQYQLSFTSSKHYSVIQDSTKFAPLKLSSVDIQILLLYLQDPMLAKLQLSDYSPHTSFYNT